MTHPLTRFRSPTVYRGDAGGHHYSLTVRHAPWRTSVIRLDIDGVAHIPTSDEEELAAKAEKADDLTTDDGVAVRSTGLLTVEIHVRRPNDDGTMSDHESITITTAALGGAGEVEVRAKGAIVPLLPEAGSRSEARDLKRTAHPMLFACAAALTTAARLAVPLLGLGALLGLLTKPVKDWAKTYISPLLEPLFQWLAPILEPIGRVIGAVFYWFIDVLRWILDVLFGWLPELNLLPDLPDWVSTVAKIVVFALVAFAVSKSKLTRRKKKLDEESQGEPSTSTLDKSSEPDEPDEATDPKPHT